MSQAWNIANLRRIAGLEAQAKQSLTESWDSDDTDDEDPDVKIANSDKGQAAFEKKHKKEIKTAGKEATAMSAAKKKPDVESPKKAVAATKKEEAPAKADVSHAKVEKKVEAEKKPAEAKPSTATDEKTSEAKTRGKKPNPESFNQQAKSKAAEFAKTHGSKGRGHFIKWAAETHGKGKHYASGTYARHSPKSSRTVAEGADSWILVHPYLKGYTLAENYELNQMQWVDFTSPLDTMVFESEAAAQKIAKFMSEWKSQQADVMHLPYEADAE